MLKKIVMDLLSWMFPYKKPEVPKELDTFNNQTYFGHGMYKTGEVEKLAGHASPHWLVSRVTDRRDK